jgi:hypothetical protein
VFLNYLQEILKPWQKFIDDLRVDQFTIDQKKGPKNDPNEQGNRKQNGGKQVILNLLEFAGYLADQRDCVVDYGEDHVPN